MKVFVSLAVLLAASFAFAKDAPKLEKTCGSESQTIQWDWCVYRSQGSANKDVLYFFHGGGGGVGKWTETEEIYQYWAKAGYAAPVLVEVSFGQLWILAPKTASPESGLYEVFTQKVIPFLENEVLRGDVGTRKAFGHSMGGLNASMLAILKPDLFKSIAVTSPAFLTLSPFADKAAVVAHSKESQVPVQTLEYMQKVARSVVTTQAEWERLSPIDAGPKVLGPQSPRYYISTGEKDVGFGYGGRRFAQILKDARVNVLWHPHAGDHNDMFPDEIAQFLMP